MTRKELTEIIRQRKSFLCIGLDPDPEKLPEIVKRQDNPLLYFNRKIIEATEDLCVAYKPNTAFFEAAGAKGWAALEETFRLISDTHLKIADAKRGDIGNTASQYAKAFFGNMNADAITLSPYMGRDAIEPFLKQEGKWAVVLAVTSNPGALDFQFTETEFSNRKLFEKVVEQVSTWGSADEIMFVAGATQTELLGKVRELVPDYFLLVPGVGAQGGNLADVCRYGITSECGLLVNSSRNIIFASGGDDFAEKARDSALGLQQEMEVLLREYGVI